MDNLNCTWTSTVNLYGQRNQTGLSPSTVGNSFGPSVLWNFGTTSGLADNWYAGIINLAPSASGSIDLTTIVNNLYETLPYNTIYFFQLENIANASGAVASNLSIGNAASSGWTPFFTACNLYGNIQFWASGGVPVTSLNKVVQINNNDAAISASIRVSLIGV